MNGRATSDPGPRRAGNKRDAEPDAHPLQTEPVDPPPPDREQLPLPRRAVRANLEPQLRTPGGIGEGTPFAAFGPTEPDEEEATDERDTARAFRNGALQARGRAGRTADTRE